MAITGNIRRATKAKLAAASGIQHFQVMDIFYNNLLELGDGSDTINVIPETFLGAGVSYKVDVSLCCDLGINRFRVISTGFYKKSEKIISSQQMQAIMETQ
jgi:NAD-dependent SIR2 family protein deacetylase